jgi:hypothetical protein
MPPVPRSPGAGGRVLPARRHSPAVRRGARARPGPGRVRPGPSCDHPLVRAVRKPACADRPRTRHLRGLADRPRRLSCGGAFHIQKAVLRPAEASPKPRRRIRTVRITPEDASERSTPPPRRLGSRPPPSETRPEGSGPPPSRRLHDALTDALTDVLVAPSCHASGSLSGVVRASWMRSRIPEAHRRRSRAPPDAPRRNRRGRFPSVGTCDAREPPPRPERSASGRHRDQIGDQIIRDRISYA